MRGRYVILISLGFVLFVLAAYLNLDSSARRRVESINCGNQMVSIGYAMRSWADDNEGRLPESIISMSNEISTPKILSCPSDHVRLRATNWAGFTLASCSYEILATNLTDHDFDKVISRCKIHGYPGYGDGPVFDGQRRRTKVLRRVQIWLRV